MKPPRLSLIVDLSAIVTNSINLGVAHSLVVQDWNAVMDQRWEIESERKRATYVLLLQTCLEQIAVRIKLPKGEQIACVF